MPISIDVYEPGQWNDFFVMVGTGAAALTGLVFVAMSLNVAAITKDPTHRYRATGTLTGLTAVFVLCALVLMGGQGHQAVGSEMFVVSVFAATILIVGYARARNAGGSGDRISLFRTIAGGICYLVEIAGAVALISGQVAGLYLVAVGIAANFFVMISGAWLLLVGVHSDS